VEKNVEGN